jgi:hypothetical protein
MLCMIGEGQDRADKSAVGTINRPLRGFCGLFIVIVMVLRRVGDWSGPIDRPRREGCFSLLGGFVC